MKSLQLRLSLGLLASLVVVFIIQWLAMSVAIRYFTENYVQTRLEHDAEALLIALHQDAGKTVINESRIDPIYKRPFDGHYFAVASSGQVLRSRSLWDTDLPVPQVKPGASIALHLPGPLDQQLLVWVGGFRKDGNDVVIAVAEELTHIHSDIRRFQWAYALLSLLVLFILMWLQRRTVRSGLRTLDITHESVRQLEQGKIKQLDESVPEEVRPLVIEVNRLLQVMNLRLERSRNALGNLAHAIKHPLMLLARLREDEEMKKHPQLVARLDQATRHMQLLIDRELKRARLAGAAAPGQHFHLEKELPPLIDTLRSLYREKGLKISYEVGPDFSFSADREDMLELFGNLLDNACKHARGKVMLTVEDGEGLRFQVEDDGPGVAEEELQRLASRGVRIDESISGHGLGLSIVRDIVRDYGGEVGFGRSPRLGGFSVSVYLPAAPWLGMLR